MTEISFDGLVLCFDKGGGDVNFFLYTRLLDSSTSGDRMYSMSTACRGDSHPAEWREKEIKDMIAHPHVSIVFNIKELMKEVFSDD